MGDLNLWWDRYGLKLLALVAAALIIGAVYPQLASRSQNPSQLSAWDSDWNDLSRFAADMEARGYTTQSLLSSPLALGELTGEQRNSTVLVILGVERVEGLKSFAALHLLQKAKGGKITTRWLGQTQRQLETAITFFGADRDVASISTADIQRFANHLQAIPNGRGGTISTGSQRHYLNSLSNLFRRAQSEGVVPPGYNPVGALMERPSGKPAEARWLEPHEAALLLESARTYQLGPSNHLAGPIYPLLATMLLTGGRTSEVLGLEVDDVSFQKQTITFRPNEWRRLKTLTSHRSVPLWPQLEDILRLYFADGGRVGSPTSPFPRVAVRLAYHGLP